MEICVCCRHADLDPPAIAHCPDRPCLPRWGCGSGDAACGVHGVSLYGCGENRDPAPSTALGSPTAYGRVAYWPPLASRAGLSIKPDLFPPIVSHIAV